MKREQEFKIQQLINQVVGKAQQTVDSIKELDSESRINIKIEEQNSQPEKFIT